MSDEVLPVTIRVMDGENVIDVIYGNERRNVLNVDTIIHTIRIDPETKEKTMGLKYKVTKVDTQQTEAGIDELQIQCVIVG